jgi:hypothetical protein
MEIIGPIGLSLLAATAATLLYWLLSTRSTLGPYFSLWLALWLGFGILLVAPRLVVGA